MKLSCNSLNFLIAHHHAYLKVTKHFCASSTLLNLQILTPDSLIIPSIKLAPLALLKIMLKIETTGTKYYRKIQYKRIHTDFLRLLRKLLSLKCIDFLVETHDLIFFLDQLLTLAFKTLLTIFHVKKMHFVVTN